jgi:hypothetical protein
VKELGPTNVIEFHHNGIDQSAVRARVCEEVGLDEAPISSAITSSARSPPLVVSCDVLIIIRPAVVRAAGLANRMHPSCFSIAYTVFVVRSKLTTASAVLHTIEA